MKEVLNRIEERYFKNSNDYETDVDVAVNIFLNVARVFEETLSDDEIRDVQNVLAQAVEAALLSYEAYEPDVKENEGEEKESKNEEKIETHEKKAKELYKYACNHDAFGDKKNARFVYAAETTIAMCLTQGVVEFYKRKYGSWKDVFDVCVAVCKSWK